MTQQITMEMQSGAHLGTQGDICFVNGKLISVAEDSMLKTFKIKDSTIEQEAEMELPGGETYAVCSNQVDMLILGGQNKTVEICHISKESDVSEE